MSHIDLAVHIVETSYGNDSTVGGSISTFCTRLWHVIPISRACISYGIRHQLNHGIWHNVCATIIKKFSFFSVFFFSRWRVDDRKSQKKGAGDRAGGVVNIGGCRDDKPHVIIGWERTLWPPTSGDNVFISFYFLAFDCSFF